MNKAQAIRLRCVECAGDSHKEATFCCAVGCPLYPFRLGYSIKDKRYEERMKLARQRYPDVFRYVMELLRDHIKSGNSTPETVRIHTLMENLWADEATGSHTRRSDQK